MKTSKKIMSTESQDIMLFQSEVCRRFDEMDKKHESSFNRLCERLERKLDASLKMQEQLSNTQRKLCDENELRLGEIRDNMCIRMESLNKRQENFQKQLSAHRIQMQKELESLNYKEEFSRQVSTERQNNISDQLFKLVEVLNALCYCVKLTDKCENFQKATAEQIKNDISELIQALEKSVYAFEKQVQELAKASSFQNTAGKPSTEGQHFTSANVEQGNLFLGDVSVQSHVIGQVDLKQFFEGNTTNKTEIQNINHVTVNQLKKTAASRNRMLMCQETMTDIPEVMSQATMTEQPESTSTSTLETMPELHTLDSHKGPVAQPHIVDGITKETIVVLGGHDSKGVVESFNTATNIWTPHEEISDGPNEVTLAVTVGDVIVIFEVSNERTRSLDIASKRWTDLESPPVYRQGMRVAVDGNLLYLTSGLRHLTRCDVYDFHSNQWSWVLNLNVGRYDHGSATLQEKVYCCGGVDVQDKVTASTEVFDPKKKIGRGRWTSVADMKVARSSFGLASCSRFLWAVGGSKDTYSLKGLERYDPVRNIWTEMADMRVGRNYPSVCFFSGNLYAIGGRTCSYKPTTTVEEYDPEKNKWTDVAPLNQKRHLHASCVVQLPSA